VITVGILGRTARFIETLDEILPKPCRESVNILTSDTAEGLQSQAPLELLAIFPDRSVREVNALPACRLLLLPGTEASLIGRCKATCAMSYGVSSKDSLTISSMEANQISVAVQRELVTVTGGTVEQQELILGIREDKALLPLLAFVGLLLVLGVPAEELPALLESKDTTIKTGI
jgi:hypothetical protein